MKIVISAFFIVVGFSFAHAEDTTFIKVEEIEKGMKGYGLTTFEGRVPERFDIEVLGVKDMMYNFRTFPVAVVKLSGGPEKYPISHVGVAGGMSGSTINVYTKDGIKELGALAYGYWFDKDPIAYIQLSQTMVNGSRNANGASIGEFRGGAGQNLSKSFGGNPVFFRGPYGIFDGLEKIFKEKGIKIENNLYAPQFLSSKVEYNSISESENIIEPGSPLAAWLVTGDIQLGVTGTVARVDSTSFLAFGHSFLNSGATSLLATSPNIITTVSNALSSYKIAESKGRFVGTIEQDNYWGIKGTIGKHPTTTPIRFDVAHNGSKKVISTKLSRIPWYSDFYAAVLAYYVLYGEYTEHVRGISGQGSVSIAQIIKIVHEDSTFTIAPAPYVSRYNEETFEDVFFDYFWEYYKLLRMLSKNGAVIQEMRFDIEYFSDEDAYNNFLELSVAEFDSVKTFPGDTLNLTLVFHSGDKKGKYVAKMPFIVPQGIAYGERVIQIKEGTHLYWKRDGAAKQLEVLQRVMSFTNTKIFVMADFPLVAENFFDGDSVHKDTIKAGKFEWIKTSSDFNKGSLRIFWSINPPLDNTMLYADKIVILDIDEKYNKNNKEEEKKKKKASFFNVLLKRILKKVT